MLRLIAETLDGETVDFQVWQIDGTYFDDDVTYVRSATTPGARFAVRTSSVRCASCDERGLS